ncbi:MAG: prolipoprotein diacylglyceryl transferase, partial [Serpentinimonas sp.]|nr:prolipoprotein diacylglyceryl transferase [Serpentinimonas sp.]
ALRRLKHPTYANLGWGRRDIEDLLFFGVLGIIIGGRLGYVLFYRPMEILAEPLRIEAVWEGGLSFHGGFIGILLAIAWFAYRRRVNWLRVTDFIAPCIPIGLASGRIGNFINGELWGRVADPALPWGMVFRGAGDLPRHPSQLYQALLEGLLLFVLLWLYARGPRRLGEVSAAFLMGYGSFRFIAEFFREPDAHLGLLGLGLSMGQWLSLPMVLAGAALWGWAHRQRSSPA